MTIVSTAPEPAIMCPVVLFVAVTGGDAAPKSASIAVDFGEVVQDGAGAVRVDMADVVG
ncbi:MAG TPA: hypothetical protein VM282_09710 [Acidimicrobiales bacterium]|nr:hypothetical protein [Acidimicrobiales bacterium]